jgi:hypothetical protein
MQPDIQAHFQDLEHAVRATAVPPDRREVIAGSVRQLSALYTKFRQTNDSRYGDEITRLVQGILSELQACPEARKLEAAFREKLRLLHEEAGVPPLALKPAPPAPGTKKARKKK